MIWKWSWKGDLNFVDGKLLLEEEEEVASVLFWQLRTELSPSLIDSSRTDKTPRNKNILEIIFNLD